VRPWLLLDRDDTILDDPGYLQDPDAIRFLPGAVEGLLRFSKAGWPLVVVTNQSGIGRGYYGEPELAMVHGRFRDLLSRHGIELAGIYHCPHAPDEGCPCRKPEPRLAQRAAEELGLCLTDSVMVGDKPSDLELGRVIGSKYVAQILAKSRTERSALADGHFVDLTALADELLL
jgi:D-glycero-D-manno-heptose 1,7-bisphosphate phosphatase